MFLEFLDILKNTKYLYNVHLKNAQHFFKITLTVKQIKLFSNVQ